MTQRTRVKFCGFVRPEDIRVATSFGVDAIGLVFYEKSSRLLDLEAAVALRRSIPSWVACVGLFVNAAPEQVRGYSSAIGLDVIQFHGDETRDQCLESLLKGQRYWRAVRMRQAADLLNSWTDYPDAEAFLLDAFSEGYGGSGKRFDWSMAPSRRDGRDGPLIVSGGLDDLSVSEAIVRLRPLGVDVSSGIQGADPRTKDPEKMEQFIAAVHAADAAA
jgi:phosphoribosylanthranilate isomerase